MIKGDIRTGFPDATLTYELLHKGLRLVSFEFVHDSFKKRRQIEASNAFVFVSLDEHFKHIKIFHRNTFDRLSGLILVEKRFNLRCA